MKITKSFILILALVLFAINVVAQTSSTRTPCSLATLKGTYGGFAEGTILAQLPGLPSPPFLAVVAGLHAFDGAGNVSITYAASFGGLIVPWGARATGRYSVASDCTVSVVATEPSGLTTHTVGTITGMGMLQEIHLMYTDPWVVASGTLKKTPVWGCSQETLKGRYTVFGQGLVTLPGFPPLLPGAHVGIFAADGLGNFAGEETVNVAGQTGPLDTFTAKYTVKPDCTMSAEITTKLGVLHEVGTITGVGGAQESHKIVVEPGWVLADADKKQ